MKKTCILGNLSTKEMLLTNPRCNNLISKHLDEEVVITSFCIIDDVESIDEKGDTGVYTTSIATTVDGSKVAIPNMVAIGTISNFLKMLDEAGEDCSELTIKAFERESANHQKYIDVEIINYN